MNYLYKREWFDNLGRLHTVKNPNIKSSENSILFTSTYHILRGGFKSSFSFIHNKNSHDNKTGLVCLQQSLGKKVNMPIHKLAQDRTWLHPRDLALYAWNKYPFLEPLCAPIISAACILSCARTYRTKKDGTKEVTTSGKMLSLIKIIAFDMKWTLKVCTWLIKRNPEFNSWTRVSRIYFPRLGHPIPLGVFVWENKQER